MADVKGDIAGLKGILGRKLGMTTVLEEGGRATPVTVIEAGPCYVVCSRTQERDGYEAVQLGFAPYRTPKRRTDQGGAALKRGRSHHRGRGEASKPQAGQFKGLEKVQPLRRLAEFRFAGAAELAPGLEVKASVFAPGDVVKVQGVSRGRGFAGAMRRWGFKGQGASHGSKIHRTPASAGATDAARVFKGKRGPGQMGNATVTVRGLRVVGVDAEKNLVLVRGGVPGARGGYVRIEAQ